MKDTQGKTTEVKGKHITIKKTKDYDKVSGDKLTPPLDFKDKYSGHQFEIILEKLKYDQFIWYEYTDRPYNTDLKENEWTDLYLINKPRMKKASENNILQGRPEKNMFSEVYTYLEHNISTHDDGIHIVDEPVALVNKGARSLHILMGVIIDKKLYAGIITQLIGDTAHLSLNMTVISSEQFETDKNYKETLEELRKVDKDIPKDPKTAEEWITIFQKFITTDLRSSKK